MNEYPIESLFGDHGEFYLGQWRRPLRRFDWERYPYRRRLPRRLRLKHWEYWYLDTPDLVLGFVAADVGYLSKMLIHCIDKHDGDYYEVDRITYPQRFDHEANGYDTALEVEAFGVQMAFASSWTTDDAHRHEIDVRAKPSLRKRGFELACRVDADFGTSEPLNVVYMPKHGGVGYTSKMMGLSGRGHVRIGEKRYPIDERAHVCRDLTKGILPRFTQWNWVFLSSTLPEGQRLSANLANWVTESTSENAIWVDGKLHVLPHPRFQHSRRHVDEPWSVRTDDGALSLVLIPAHVTKQDLNVGLVRSCWRHPIGHAFGHIDLPGTLSTRLERVPAIWEEMRTVW
jgi:hypothetical protein